MKFSYCCNYSWLAICSLVVLGSSIYANHDLEVLSQLDDIAGPSSWSRSISSAKAGPKDKTFTDIGLWTTNVIVHQAGGAHTDDDIDTINSNTNKAGKVDDYTRGDVRVLLNRGTTIANAALSLFAILMFINTMITKKRCYTAESAVAISYILFGLCSLFGTWWWWRSSYLNWARVEKSNFVGFDVDNTFCALSCQSAAVGGILAVYCGLWMLIVTSGHFMCRLNEEYEEEEDTTSPVVVTNEDVDVEVGETKKQAQRRLSEPLVQEGPSSSEPAVNVDAGPTGNGYTHWVGKSRDALDRNHTSKHAHHER